MGSGDGRKKYHIERKGDILIFRTSLFAAGDGSVLHSGIYNREFASVLTASAVSGIICMVVFLSYGRATFLYMIFIILSAALIPFFNRFVFREKVLETVFDKAAGKTEFYLEGIGRRKKDEVRLADIGNVIIESRRQSVENPDGVEFVEKIAAQHGTVIPGFGEEKTFFVLKLMLADGSDRLIYADTEMKDVMDAHEEVKEFLKLSS